MRIYLVGGAVRDKLLNRPVIEKDWVVVGATPGDMLKQGFRPVGKDFPVFLHPETQEEYALARKERKVKPGYTGFEFDASPIVTLEEDLMRRDLTINAMAQTEDDILVDPFNGKQDLETKILRHVSPAFTEDPVRVLRVARFAARYKELGFAVAPETITLMQEMVTNGEVNALVPERVWKELEKTLGEKNPEEFFTVLIACNAQQILFPELTEINLQRLQKTALKSTEPQIRFAALLSSLDAQQIKTVCERYKVPNDYRDLAVLVASYGSTYQKAKSLSAKELLELLQSLDAFRREERFQKFLKTSELISENNFSDWLYEILRAAKNIDIKPLLLAGYENSDLAEKIVAARVQAIEAAMGK